jgi:hypothetical protein
MTKAPRDRTRDGPADVTIAIGGYYVLVRNTQVAGNAHDFAHV